MLDVVLAHINTPLTPPNEVVPEITQPTNDALMIAMAKNPRERFPTYDDFIMAFTAARSQLLRQQFRPQEDAEEGGPGPTQHGKGWWRR